MKKRNQFKKLQLNKETIIKLTNLALKDIKGGIPQLTPKCDISARPVTFSKISYTGSCQSDCY